MAWRPKYKQLCAICKKNHVLIISRNQFPICTACSMREISKPIEDEKFRKMFDIDQKLYEESSFLRSIKSNYLRFGSLSEKQVETFKKVAAELANPEASKRSAQTEAATTTARAPVAIINKKEETASDKAKKAKPKTRKTNK